jgi:NADPH2:quinone reductase
VALIESDLPWEALAAIPETYATAWTCLFRNLEIAEGRTVVIRGATSSFGQAAVNLAVNAGARVIATTRNRRRFAMLEELGAERVELEGPGLAQRIAEAKQLDAVLDLVGNSTILDSLAMTIGEHVAAGRLEAKPSRVFRFEEIREAHRVMEANEAHGKMVVVVD